MKKLSRVMSGLRKTQTALRKGAFDNYRRLLHTLLADHQEHEFTKALSAALRRKDFRELVNLADSLSKQQYTDATSHFVANQFSLLIRKYPFPPEANLGFDPRRTAIDKFLSVERRMKRVNRKFHLLTQHPGRDAYSKQIGKMRYWIRSVIGSQPNYKSVFESCDFGPGASMGVHGNATNFARKFSSKRWTVSPGALHHGYAAIRNNHHLFEALCPRGVNGMYCYDEEAAFTAYLSRIEVVTNNKISFVPKTVKTERSIAVEPLLNGFVQKGIDQVLRRKLLGFGIDLRDQGRNQKMAREGSLDDSEDGFVTIDLESASDSLSIGAVSYLLPPDWVTLLQRTRSHAFELEKGVMPFNKFCSMGNGFCFPLETLVFAAACYAVGAGSSHTDFSVYGDDIIVRKKFAADVIALLRHLGFKTNRDKTFLEGPFRESCGEDWFGGHDVRPFTLDYTLDSLESLYKFLNLTRTRTRSKSFFSNARGLVLSMIPDDFRYFRPLTGPPDTGIDSTGDEHLTSPHCSFHGGKWTWFVLSHSPKIDLSILEVTQSEPWLISVALRGGRPIKFGRYSYLPEVTHRREVMTKVARESYASVSNWLPPYAS